MTLSMEMTVTMTFMDNLETIRSMEAKVMTQSSEMTMKRKHTG